MNADNTEKLIAKAIAALPYSSPRAGFGARVMAAIEEQAAAETWLQRALKAGGVIVAAWSAGLSFLAARLIHANFGNIAAALIEPGGVSRAFSLLAAHGALILAKLAAAAPLIAGWALDAMPPYHEMTAAAILCAAAVAPLARIRTAADKN